MNPGSLWQISVETAKGAEDAIAELLASELGQSACSYTDIESGATTITAYFEEKADWSRAKQQRLERGIAALKAGGVQVGPVRITLAKIRREDWAESWRRHFKPIEIGPELLIKPGWSRRRARRGQAVVVLDPGLSFGTGQHPTTGFCLEQLVARRKPGTAQSFLDAGTGSGILAIAAAKLGYAPVEAFDVDPDAVRIARANGRENRVNGRIRFHQQDLAKLPRLGAKKYSVVCANLISSLLLAERDRILARLETGGLLVIAGILKAEFRLVQCAYEAAGLRLAASRTENEWRSGAFRSKQLGNRKSDSGKKFFE